MRGERAEVEEGAEARRRAEVNQDVVDKWCAGDSQGVVPRVEGARQYLLGAAAKRGERADAELGAEARRRAEVNQDVVDKWCAGDSQGVVPRVEGARH